MSDVEARDGLVWMTVPDAYGLDTTNAWIPTYARELAAALIAAADAADNQK
jgi:hypothetical protein